MIGRDDSSGAVPPLSNESPAPLSTSELETILAADGWRDVERDILAPRGWDLVDLEWNLVNELGAFE